MIRRSFALLLVVLAVVFAGCLAPTLPVPPPDVDEITAPAAGSDLWHVTGTCIPGAFVFVFNDTLGEGALFEDRDFTGKFGVDLKGEACDAIWVEQEESGERGQRENHVLEPTDAPDTCP